jgi:succinoglycan biosynthesis protein ExoO
MTAASRKPSEGQPVGVSVIMANHNGAAHLPAAIQSVLGQTLRDMELVIYDDASSDGSVAVAQGYAVTDPRVKVIAGASNRGPGAARNAAIAAARGDWIAIVDSDDLLHPQRLERLLLLAEARDADIVADDLLYFSQADRTAGHTLIGSARRAVPDTITPELFVLSNSLGSQLPALGYLKPLFRRKAIAGIAYDETAWIGEDYDFLLRCLLAGAKLVLHRTPLYFYRRHSTSLSHRLSETHVTAMIGAHDRLVKDHRRMQPEIRALLDARRASLCRALSFEKLVSHIKRRALVGAGLQLVTDPWLLSPLFQSAREHMSRSRGHGATGGPSRTTLLLHGPDIEPQRATALMRAAGIGADARPFVVPAYRERTETAPPGAEEIAQLADLARLGLQNQTSVIAIGEAGQFALPFVIEFEHAVIVSDDAELPEEASLAGNVSPAPPLLADAGGVL